MKFKMAENSLFAILLRSSWWTSFAVAAGVVMVARLVLPEQYVIGGALGALPFLVIGMVAAWRQLRLPGARRVASTLDVVGSMSWREFSDAVETAFRRDGYAVRRLNGGAADFELNQAGRTSLLCCKRWKAASTGVESLRDLDLAKEARGAHEGIYVVMGGVTDNARKYATERKLRIVAGVELVQLLRDVKRAK